MWQKVELKGSTDEICGAHGGQLTDVDVVFEVDEVVFELPPAVLEGEALRAM